MVSVVELDDKGRLTLPRRLRESLKMGKKVLVINAGDHVKVIPLPPDLLQTLHGAFNIKKRFKELRKEAESIAEEESKSKVGGSSWRMPLLGMM